MSLIRPRFNYDSFYFPPPTLLSHSPLPQSERMKEKSSSLCLGFLLPFYLSLPHPFAHTYIPHAHTRKKGKENHSATSVLPFSATVMNRELSSGGPIYALGNWMDRVEAHSCLLKNSPGYQIISYQKGQHPCFADDDHSSGN